MILQKELWLILEMIATTFFIAQSQDLDYFLQQLIATYCLVDIDGDSRLRLQLVT